MGFISYNINKIQKYLFNSNNIKIILNNNDRIYVFSDFSKSN